MTDQFSASARSGDAAAWRNAPYGWLTPYFAQLATLDEKFAARILTITREEQHFIALTLAMMGARRDDTDHFNAFASQIGVLTRKTFFATMAPACDAALCNLAAKLRGRVWPIKDYDLLAQMFANGQARKTLRHRSHIHRRHVRRLGTLPAGFRTPAILAKIYSKSDLREIVFAIETVRAIRPALNDQSIATSLAKSTDCSRDWVLKHYAHAPFPAAPVSPIAIAQGALVPLTSHDDLADDARHFKNCIRTYLMRVLRGDSYFYRFTRKGDDKGAAIVELKRAPVIGWVVHEAYGPSNDKIKGRDRTAILGAFQRAGIGAAPQAVDPDAWFALE